MIGGDRPDAFRAAPDGIIAWAAAEFGAQRVAFASSLGLEDQALTEILRRTQPDIDIVTIDTGRLFPETRDLMEKTARQYGFRYGVLFPDRDEVEQMVAERGESLFYRSVADRRRCCEIRKIRPLRTGLAGRAAWITGLRRGQSAARAGTGAVEWDGVFGLYKVNPLWNWTMGQVWEHVRAHDVPYSPLHDRGFASIGCAPCTRATGENEEARAGRWWWESSGKKECGLHGLDRSP